MANKFNLRNWCLNRARIRRRRTKARLNWINKRAELMKVLNNKVVNKLVRGKMKKDNKKV